MFRITDWWVKLGLVNLQDSGPPGLDFRASVCVTASLTVNMQKQEQRSEQEQDIVNVFWKTGKVDETFCTNLWNLSAIIKAKGDIRNNKTF